MTVAEHIAHDLECASAAYAVLLERAEKRGDHQKARALRRELAQYRASALSSPHGGSL
jgi:hypothetical protein